MWHCAQVCNFCLFGRHSVTLCFPLHVRLCGCFSQPCGWFPASDRTLNQQQLGREHSTAKDRWLAGAEKPRPASLPSFSPSLPLHLSLFVFVFLPPSSSFISHVTERALSKEKDNALLLLAGFARSDSQTCDAALPNTPSLGPISFQNILWTPLKKHPYYVFFPLPLTHCFPKTLHIDTFLFPNMFF